ncbi:hypothetical protein SAMN05428951_10930 [Pseudomonas sp. OV546]|nr:hypothetical protein SAMN05428951_10930 [Pseudomonas sp. OV546]
MITFGHAEFAQLILEVFALLQGRASLRGLNRKKLIVHFVPGLILKGRQSTQHRDNHLTGAGLRHGLRVVVVPGAPSYRMLTGAVLMVLATVLSAQSAGGIRAGPIAERLLDSPMVISPRPVIIRIGQITGAPCFLKALRIPTDMLKASGRSIDSQRLRSELPLSIACLALGWGHPFRSIQCMPSNVPPM